MPPRLWEIVGADHLLRVRARLVAAHLAALLLLLPSVARHAALAAGLARFLARPLVRGAFLVRRLAAFARDLSLLVPVHRRKAAIFFCHAFLLALRGAREHSGCNRCATE